MYNFENCWNYLYLFILAEMPFWNEGGWKIEERVWERNCNMREGGGRCTAVRGQQSIEGDEDWQGRDDGGAGKLWKRRKRAPQLRKEVADGQNVKSSPKRFAPERMPTELFDVRHVYSACYTWIILKCKHSAEQGAFVRNNLRSGYHTANKICKQHRKETCLARAYMHACMHDNIHTLWAHTYKWLHNISVFVRCVCVHMPILGTMFLHETTVFVLRRKLIFFPWERSVDPHLYVGSLQIKKSEHETKKWHTICRIAGGRVAHGGEEQSICTVLASIPHLVPFLCLTLPPLLLPSLHVARRRLWQDL